MKTLQQHIEEKLIINKNYVDADYNLDDIFPLIKKSEYLDYDEDSDTVLDVIDHMFQKAFYNNDFLVLSSEYETFMKKYKKENLPLNGLNKAHAVLVYSNPERFIHDHDTDQKIHKYISKNSYIQFPLFDEKCCCYISSNTKYLFIEIYDIEYKNNSSIGLLLAVKWK